MLNVAGQITIPTFVWRRMKSQWFIVVLLIVNTGVALAWSLSLSSTWACMVVVVVLLSSSTHTLWLLLLSLSSWFGSSCSAHRVIAFSCGVGVVVHNFSRVGFFKRDIHVSEYYLLYLWNSRVLALWNGVDILSWSIIRSVVLLICSVLTCNVHSSWIWILRVGFL